MKKVLISILTLILCVIPVLGLAGCEDERDTDGVFYVKYLLPESEGISHTITLEQYLSNCKFFFNNEQPTDPNYEYTIIYIYDQDDVEKRRKTLVEQGYANLVKFNEDENDHRYKAMYHIGSFSYDGIKARKIPLTVHFNPPETVTDDNKHGQVTFVMYGVSYTHRVTWN